MKSSSQGWTAHDLKNFFLVRAVGLAHLHGPWLYRWQKIFVSDILSLEILSDWFILPSLLAFFFIFLPQLLPPPASCHIQMGRAHDARPWPCDRVADNPCAAPFERIATISEARHKVNGANWAICRDTGQLRATLWYLCHYVWISSSNHVDTGKHVTYQRLMDCL